MSQNVFIFYWCACGRFKSTVFGKGPCGTCRGNAIHREAPADDKDRDERVKGVV